MSYEGRHWSCGHDRHECDGNCTLRTIPTDCPDCGRDAMVCDCPLPNTRRITQKRNRYETIEVTRAHFRMF